MKKLITILTAVVLIASGMHISLASHYCEGRLASVILSVTGEQATCGMESCMPVMFPYQKSINDNCCENHLSQFSLGIFESMSSINTLAPDQRINHILPPAAGLLLSQEYSFKAPGLSTGPPGSYYPESPSSKILCVFRN